MHAAQKNGFTLIELSIVLVIISLIVGGVIGGKSLIHSARLQAVITEVTQFRTAINTFKLQYDAIPGDMRDAYDYWGTACDAYNINSCNGDGNNILDNCNTCGHQQENMEAWAHLYLAGLIKHALHGEQMNNGLPGWAAIGENIPPAAIDGAGYILRHGSWNSDTPSFGKLGNAIVLGRVYSGSNYLSDGAITPKDARTIDRKIDDGAADGGDMRPASISNNELGGNDCVGGTAISSSSSGSYDVSDPDKSCRIMFFF